MSDNDTQPIWWSMTGYTSEHGWWVPPTCPTSPDRSET